MYNAGDRVVSTTGTALGDELRQLQPGSVGVVKEVFRSNWGDTYLTVEWDKSYGGTIDFTVYDREVEHDSRDNARSAVLVSGAVASVGEARRLSDAAWGILFIWLVVIGVALGTFAVGWSIAKIVGY